MANVCRAVSAVATVDVPKFVGSTTIPTFLKSFSDEMSSPSAPVSVVFVITKWAPNSSIAFEPCPPLGDMITSKTGSVVPPMADAVVKPASENV